MFEPEERSLLGAIGLLPRSQETRIISYGLYGTKAKYLIGAIRNTQLAKLFYPGWTVRFYHSNGLPRGVLDELRGLGAQLVPCGENTGIEGMFWRFKVSR